MRHNVREETGRTDVTVRAIRQLRTSGRHENTLPFVGRVLGHMKLYGERERGGGEYRQTTGSRLLGRDHWGGAVFYRPPP